MTTPIPKEATDVKFGACSQGYCVFFTLENSNYLALIPIAYYKCSIPIRQFMYIQTFIINLN